MPIDKQKLTLNIFSILGIIISIYLSIDHYSNHILACPHSTFINCQSVTTSTFSTIFSIPISMPGIFFFLVIGILTNLNLKYNLKLRLILTSFAEIFVLYLIKAEIIDLKQICLWCTALHIIITGIFLITLYQYLRLRNVKL